MRDGLIRPVDKIPAAVLKGCKPGQIWPHVPFLRDGEPELPDACRAYGRVLHRLK